jgi:hypothetical protein
MLCDNIGETPGDPWSGDPPPLFKLWSGTRINLVRAPLSVDYCKKVSHRPLECEWYLTVVCGGDVSER